MVASELGEVEKILAERLKVENPLISEIGSYVCNSGGKRLRPVMLLLAARICGDSDGQAPLFASVMELIHVATLLHDDVLDRAEVRRGKPSANTRWSNNVSVLTGDYLYSWSLFALEEAQKPAILKLVIQAVMTMTDGEILESVKKGDLGITEGEYLEIIEKKTAHLFSCSCRAGAIIEGDNHGWSNAMAEYGINTGMAFQIMDDILDYTADQARLGKVIGGDVREKNFTLPIIHAMACANRPEKERIREIFAGEELAEGDFAYCLDLIHKYKSFDYALAKAGQYVEKARNCLTVFEDSIYRDAFFAISEYSINRDH